MKNNNKINKNFHVDKKMICVGRVIQIRDVEVFSDRLKRKEFVIEMEANNQGENEQDWYDLSSDIPPTNASGYGYRAFMVVSAFNTKILLVEKLHLHDKVRVTCYNDFMKRIEPDGTVRKVGALVLSKLETIVRKPIEEVLLEMATPILERPEVTNGDTIPSGTAELNL